MALEVLYDTVNRNNLQYSRGRNCQSDLMSRIILQCTDCFLAVHKCLRYR